jgi:uncharacterized protein involved in exopolysaccharide biosynthesis
MPEPFELFRYLEHLRRRWRLVALACGIAVALALVTGLVIPNSYTATARILIDTPAGSELHTAVALSPIYLESLKTYELVASGDRLFRDAIEHFKLPRSKSVDALKRSVLKVRIPHNTKLLEVSATLSDPRQAQALALYIADQTVRLTREISLEGDRDLIADSQKQLDEARGRMEQAERTWAQLAGQPLNQAAERSGTVDAAQAEREAARTTFEQAEKRLQEVRSYAGYRGERLTVVDPGVVPEQPSWPNIPLMVAIALLLAFAGSLVYVTFEFNYRPDRAATPRPVAPLARVKGLND